MYNRAEVSTRALAHACLVQLGHFVSDCLSLISNYALLVLKIHTKDKEEELERRVTF